MNNHLKDKKAKKKLTCRALELKILLSKKLKQKLPFHSHCFYILYNIYNI